MYSFETVQRLQNQIISMQEKIDLLQAELTDAKDTNELLEFQLLENNEDTKHKFEVIDSLPIVVGHFFFLFFFHVLF